MTVMRLSQPADMPPPPNTFSDFEWIRANEAQLLEKYGEGFLIVYEERVLGFGTTLDDALVNAGKNLPPGDGEIFPVIDTIYHRHPFTRIVSRALSISLDELNEGP